MIQLHDVRTAARLLGISHYTVRLLIGKGVLHPVRIGRRVLLEEQELQRFIGLSRTSQELKEES